MKWLAAILLCFLPALARADVDAETQRGWEAFKEVCLEQVSDVKMALHTIPELARKHTGNNKITDQGYREKQLIRDGIDAWSFNDGRHWFMILTDYGSCSVRVPGGFDSADFAVKELGYIHFHKLKTKWNDQDFYYMEGDDSPVITVVHVEVKGERRLLFQANNSKVYRLAVKYHPEDNPPLPDMKQ